MNINDLDQNKTEQSIANERARLDTCRVTLERLKQERDRVQNQYTEKIGRLVDQIKSIEISIIEGEMFIEKCQTHLNELKNG